MCECHRSWLMMRSRWCRSMDAVLHQQASSSGFMAMTSCKMATCYAGGTGSRSCALETNKMTHTSLFSTANTCAWIPGEARKRTWVRTVSSCGVVEPSLDITLSYFLNHRSSLPISSSFSNAYARGLLSHREMYFSWTWDWLIIDSQVGRKTEKNKLVVFSGCRTRWRRSWAAQTVLESAAFTRDRFGFREDDGSTATAGGGVGGNRETNKPWWHHKGVRRSRWGLLWCRYRRVRARYSCCILLWVVQCGDQEMGGGVKETWERGEETWEMGEREIGGGGEGEGGEGERVREREGRGRGGRESGREGERQTRGKGRE